MYAKFFSNPDGCFNLRVKRLDYTATMQAVERILAQHNELTLSQRPIYITQGRAPEALQSDPWELWSFYSETSKGFASIQFDAATGIISELTTPIRSTKKTVLSKLYAQVVEKSGTKKLVITPQCQPLQELEVNELKNTNRMLEQEIFRLQKLLADSNIDYCKDALSKAPSLKEEIAGLLKAHTKDLKEQVMSRINDQPFTQTHTEPEETLNWHLESSHLTSSSPLRI